jgi:hypothetical protein
MAAKRHHVDDMDGPEDLSGRGEPVSEKRASASPNSNVNEPRTPKPAAQSYPRKRVAVAVSPARKDVLRLSCEAFC